MSELLILRAIEFAARKHANQRRKDENASPYINHPVSVAFALAEIGRVKDSEILAAAILHDTLEDTETTKEELGEAFGSRVLKLVEEVTDDKRKPKAERKRLQVERARHLSPGAAQIKLGDKISNISDLIHSPPIDWSLERKREYLIWSEAVIANCPKVNNALGERFSQVLEKGRRILL